MATAVPHCPRTMWLAPLSKGRSTTWRDGGKPGAIEGTEPAVQVNDTPWSQGDRLGSYEILKEDTSGAEKKFTVRLSLTKPERVEEVQYYVIGQRPGDGLSRPGLLAKHQHGRRPKTDQAGGAEDPQPEIAFTAGATTS